MRAMSAEENLKSRTAKGILWGAIGSGGVQLLNLFFGIFLSRILTPADYGIVGSLVIFSTLAGIFSESGFVLAIVNKKEATRRDYNALFWFSVAMSLTIYLILWICAPLIADFYHQPEMVKLSRFLFTGFIFSATASAPTAYMFRNLLVKERTRAQLTALTVAGAVGVVCALCGMSYWAIAIQSVSYMAINALVLWVAAKWRPQFSFHPEALRGMLSFSLKQLVVSLFTVVNANLFAVLLGRFYGMVTTGNYTQGNKWTTMGQSTISGTINSIGQPVMREASGDAERLRRVFRKLLRFTAFVSFPCMFGLAIVSRELIVIAVTEKWLASVPVMQILCVGAAFVPAGVLCGNLFNSIRRPGVYMWNTIALGATQIVALLITCRFSLVTMLTVYTAINILWLLVWQRCLWRCLRIPLRSVVKDIAPYILLTCIVMAIAVAAAHCAANLVSPSDTGSGIPLTAGAASDASDARGAAILWLTLAVKIVVAVTLYPLLMWRLRSSLFSEAVGFLRKRIKLPKLKFWVFTGILTLASATVASAEVSTRAEESDPGNPEMIRISFRDARPPLDIRLIYGLVMSFYDGKLEVYGSGIVTSMSVDGVKSFSYISTTSGVDAIAVEGAGDEAGGIPQIDFTGEELIIYGAPRGSRISVCDLGGRLIIHKTFDGHTSLSLSALPSGVYVVAVNDTKLKITRQ